MKVLRGGLSLGLAVLAVVICAAPAHVAEPVRGLALDLGDGVSMEVVLIRPGTFTMGSEKNGSDHEVTISQPFYIGKYPVTQEQWQAIMGNSPSRFKGTRNPVDSVSWNDARDFCKRLSTRTRKAVRLPTEAEWEYACRAGSRRDYCFGDDENGLAEYAWYENNSSRTTHAVGTKNANPWGLYDMHGNVWEWCQDLYDPRYYANGPRVDPPGPTHSDRKAHVLRGGAWHVEAAYCRSAARGGDFPCGEGGPGSWDDAGCSGFRVAVTASRSP